MSSVLEPLIYSKKDVKSCSSEEIKLSLESFDSGEECSLSRLVHVHQLLEIEDQELDRCIFDDACLHVA